MTLRSYSFRIWIKWDFVVNDCDVCAASSSTSGTKQPLEIILKKKNPNGPKVPNEIECGLQTLFVSQCIAWWERVQSACAERVDKNFCDLILVLSYWSWYLCVASCIRRCQCRVWLCSSDPSTWQKLINTTPYLGESQTLSAKSANITRFHTLWNCVRVNRCYSHTTHSQNLLRISRWITDDRTEYDLGCRGALTLRVQQSLSREIVQVRHSAMNESTSVAAGSQ